MRWPRNIINRSVHRRCSSPQSVCEFILVSKSEKCSVAKILVSLLNSRAIPTDPVNSTLITISLAKFHADNTDSWGAILVFRSFLENKTKSFSSCYDPKSFKCLSFVLSFLIPRRPTYVPMCAPQFTSSQVTVPETTCDTGGSEMWINFGVKFSEKPQTLSAIWAFPPTETCPTNSLDKHTVHFGRVTKTQVQQMLHKWSVVFCCSKATKQSQATTTIRLSVKFFSIRTGPPRVKWRYLLFKFLNDDDAIRWILGNVPKWIILGINSGVIFMIIAGK